MPMKTLLVEDDATLCDTLVQALEPHYVVDVAHTGRDGIRQGRINQYDAVILDIGLPDMDGLEVCEAIRAKRPTTPILVLTALRDVGRKVAALDEGADDYVVKPVATPELLARLRALMRRNTSGQRQSNLIELGPLRLDVVAHTVHWEELPIRLRPKEFALLEYLMRHQGTVVTRAMILEHVWETDVDSFSNTVDVHIKYLRDKVCRPFNVDLIKTVPGVGYKMEAP